MDLLFGGWVECDVCGWVQVVALRLHLFSIPAVCLLPGWCSSLSALGDQPAGSEEAELTADAREPEDEDQQEHREDQEEDDEQSRSNRVRL